MRILVTGAGGQLGHDVVTHGIDRGDDVLAFDHTTLDVTSRDAVLGAITTLRPDAVVHCAAWTAVDACESDHDKAFLANSLAVRWVAEGARRAGAHLCHISTDYVFSGDKATPYHEWDETGPLSVYGASKLGGEIEAMNGAPGATVVRTSWVCGEHGNNMVKTILRIAAAQPELTFVSDQRGHPSFTEDLAVAIRRLVVDRRPGVYHVTNQGAVSWYEFAQAVLEASGADPQRVQPITTAEFQPPRPAKRPYNSVLDNAALRLAGDTLLDDFREPLGRLVKKLTA